MTRFIFFVAGLALSLSAQASWFWPFGSQGEKDVPRLSEIMLPASTNIDAAADFVAEGKVAEAIEAYKKALIELDKVEAMYPERVQLPEFSTVKTKRALVMSAIDNLKLNEVMENVGPVSVTDTKELEEKLRKERSLTRQNEVDSSSEVKKAPSIQTIAPQQKEDVKKISSQLPKRAPQSIAEAIARGEYEFAATKINEILKTNPKDIKALNLKAAMECAQKKYSEAERTLDIAISSNPRSYHAYYNMARLKLMSSPPDCDGARRYYKTGRAYGGVENKWIEERLK